MPYRSSHVAKIYDISLETVRVWSEEFAEYLSPTANPGKHKHRLFIADDMAVFALVSDLKNKGFAFAEIHASLKSGQRGEPPAIEPDEVQALVASDHEKVLSFQVEQLEAALVASQQKLKMAEEALTQMREVQDENIRLKTQLEGKEQQLQATKEELQKQVDELSRRLEERSVQTGQEYSKGFLAGFREGQHTTSQDNNKSDKSE